MNTIFILKIYSFIRFNSCTTDVLIPSKTKCARGNVTYLWSCMIKHLKDNKAKCECATQPKEKKKETELKSPAIPISLHATA